MKKRGNFNCIFVVVSVLYVGIKLPRLKRKKSGFKNSLSNQLK
jgi:hypothetical protein